MDNDNDISLMKAEARGTLTSYDEDDDLAADWANREFAQLMKWTPKQRKVFELYGFSYDDGTFFFLPPGAEVPVESDTLLGCIDEWLKENAPVRVAMLELRHQLRRAK